MEYLSWFVIDFVVVFLIYYFFIIRKARRGKKVPSEVKFLIDHYKLDTKKFNYRRFLLSVGLVVSFDIAIVGVFLPLIKEFIWQIAFGFIAIIPVVAFSFYLLGIYYQRKQANYDKESIEKEKSKKKGSKKNVK